MPTTPVYDVTSALKTCVTPAPIPDTLNVSGMNGTYFTDADGPGIIQAGISTVYTYNGAQKKYEWNTLNGYYNTIAANATGTGPLLKAVATQETETNISIPNINTQSANDVKLSARIQSEYCFYGSLYHGYLNAFLTEITATNPTTGKAEQLLTILKDLNMKLNALADFVDYYATVRIAYVNIKAESLNTLNAAIQTSINITSAPAAALEGDQSILNTRKEMIRYTKEKNNSIRNQVSLWAALNIVAFGMIFHLYRTL
jgi:hypothetical protein